MKRIRTNSQVIDWNNPESIDNYSPEDEYEYLPEDTEIANEEYVDPTYSSHTGETKEIHLYPCTDNTANLAVLIDVPQDTFDRLDYIKEQCQEEKADWRDEYYERISDDEELQKADDFLTYGWGRFSVPVGYPRGDTFQLYGPDNDLALRLFNSATKKDVSKHLSPEYVIHISSGLRWY
tara:strand:- start:87 stop:623 length:537 start_codon:yes stop_codon:yes gene_type:complete